MLLARVVLASVLLALLASTLLPAPVAAQTQDAPLLRIDTSAHSAAIRALDVDAAGRYAVTASEDKTARVWDLASGQLLQTLRPPVGPGNDGKLFAAAITPDGSVVAAGGWSADNDVYLFERATGAMVQRITGLPNTITRLAFSPDGQALLIGLWGKQGVRLFYTASGWRNSIEGDSDPKYQGEVYGAHFSPDGKRLATASMDGLVRVYDVTQRRLKLLASARPAGGNQPFSVAYAPVGAPDVSSKGAVLAVSFADTPAVAVLQADTLQLAYTPSAAGITNGSLNALAWSADGRELLAGGTWKRADGTHGLRIWAARGRGPATDASLASDSVVALRALADARVVYAAADAAWGWRAPGPAAAAAAGATPLIQPGRPTHSQSVRSGLVDFREGRSDFRVARDGSAIAFGLRRDDFAVSRTVGVTSDVVGFDVKNAAWTPPLTQWLPANASVSTTGKSLQVGDWFDSVRPKLNGSLLALTDNEVAMTATVAPDARGAALGTSFYLRYYLANGTLLWRVTAPGTAWQVNVSGDGRWVIAAFSDGTLRWYRTRDGIEQLALLPHADRKRWVAWTPQGYYAASPGGEDLFGWQLNRGPSRAADFFPASRFRAVYFRPDVVAAVLATADFDAALKLANQAHQVHQDAAPAAMPASAAASSALVASAIGLQTPPVVTVLSPKDGDSFSTREVTLSITIRAPVGAPALSLRARLNGSIFDLPQAQASTWTVGRNLVVEAPGTDGSLVRYEQRITLAPQDAELMVFADNRNGYSTPAVLRLKWTGAKTGSASAPVATPPSSPLRLQPEATPDLRPALYVLAVGVSKYQNQGIALAFAAKDATDFAHVFKLQENQLYRKVDVRLLTDANAKRDDILDGLEWIRREMTARDVGVVFMAGHGINDSDGVYYYLPQDTEPDRLKRTGVIFTEIRNTLAALPGKALFFVDTCHSGNVLGTGRRGLGSDLTAIVNELSSAENGVVVFAASTGRQSAQESPEWGNGAFTRAVVEGMSGKADVGRTGRVTHKMLDLYVSERVKALTRGAQSPVTIVPQGIADFPVAISR